VFERFISIDWSGARTDTDRVDIRVVEADTCGRNARVVDPTMVNASPAQAALFARCAFRASSSSARQWRESRQAALASPPIPRSLSSAFRTSEGGLRGPLGDLGLSLLY
jgi:hypothetical protein